MPSDASINDKGAFKSSPLPTKPHKCSQTINLTETLALLPAIMQPENNSDSHVKMEEVTSTPSLVLPATGENRAPVEVKVEYQTFQSKMKLHLRFAAALHGRLTVECHYMYREPSRIHEEDESKKKKKKKKK